VQALKAGLMEIADIFCVNKADREGAGRIVSELNMIMDIKREKSGREFPVVTAQAVNNVGLDDLMEVISKEMVRIKSGDFALKHRRRKIRYDIMKTVEHRLKNRLRKDILSDERLSGYIEEIFEGRGNPYDLARRLIDDLK